jgi:hypothetical protein
MTSPVEAEGSFASDVAKKFSERFAERQDFSEVVGGEVRAGPVRICAFAAHLNDADNLAIQQIRRADHFLDCARGSIGDFYALENRGVPRGGKIILDLGATVAGGALRGLNCWKGG